MRTPRPASERVVRWRANWVNWVMFVPLCAGMLTLSCLSLFAFDGWIARIGMSAFFLAAALTMTVMICAYIDLYPDEIVIGGWLRRTRTKPLSSIQNVSAGRYGLSFRTGPYEGFSGPGLIGAKGDWPSFLHLPEFRGDRIAREIAAHAEAARAAATRSDVQR